LPGIIFATQQMVTREESSMATGTIIVQLDNALLTLLMEQGLKQVKPRMPFAITNITVSTHADKPIELHAGRPPLSITLQCVPTIDAAGQLDLQITQTRLLFMSLPGFINHRLAATINTRANALLQEMAAQDIQGMHVHIEEVHTIEGALVVTAQVSALETSPAIAPETTPSQEETAS
jgi:hypothetical protein